MKRPLVASPESDAPPKTLKCKSQNIPLTCSLLSPVRRYVDCALRKNADTLFTIRFITLIRDRMRPSASVADRAASIVVMQDSIAWFVAPLIGHHADHHYRNFRFSEISVQILLAAHRADTFIVTGAHFSGWLFAVNTENRETFRLKPAFVHNCSTSLSLRT